MAGKDFPSQSDPPVGHETQVHSLDDVVKLLYSLQQRQEQYHEQLVEEIRASSRKHAPARPSRRQAAQVAQEPDAESSRTHVLAEPPVERCAVNESANLEKEISSSVADGRNCVKRFATSPRFDALSAMVLITNSVFIGVQVEFSYNEEQPYSLTVIDYIYTSFFIVEVCLRLYANGCKAYFTGSDKHWNWFDFLVVGFSTIDTAIGLLLQGKVPLGNISVVRVIRTVRITRVLRVIRVMRFFKELRIMISAIFHTLKTASWAFLLMVAVIYICAVALSQLIAEYLLMQEVNGSPVDPSSFIAKYYSSLPHTLLTLFMAITGGIGWEDALLCLVDVGPLPTTLMFCYVVFTYLCMLNVIVGIFCQNAVEAFDADREKVIEVQLSEKARYVDILTDLFKSWDESGEGTISVQTFEKHVQEEEVQALLNSIDVDTRDAIVLFQMLAGESGEVSNARLNLDEFVAGCITMRGSAKAIHMEKTYIGQLVMQEKVSFIMGRMNEMYDLILDISALTENSREVLQEPHSKEDIVFKSSI